MRLPAAMAGSASKRSWGVRLRRTCCEMTACKRMRRFGRHGALVVVQGGKQDPGVTQVWIALHRRDGEHPQALVRVRQALQGVGEHFAQAFVDPGGARKLPGSA